MLLGFRFGLFCRKVCLIKVVGRDIGFLSLCSMIGWVMCL